MNGNTAIDILMQRCGNRQDSAFRPVILAEMQLVQQTQLEQGTTWPWFLLKDTDVLATNLNWPVNTEAISLPNDFLGFDDDSGCGVWVRDTTSTDIDPWVPVNRRPYASMKALALSMGDTNTDSPFAFDIVGNSLYLRPFQTDTAKTVRLIYFGTDSAVVADAALENNWLKYAPDLLIGMTGMQLATLGYVTDAEIAQGFAAQVVAASKRLADKNEAMKHMLQNYTMGD